MTTYGIVVFDGAEELDFAGPFEVFGTSASMRAAGDRVLLLAATTDPIRCANGLRVIPELALTDAPALDVVLVPGGVGTRAAMSDPSLLGWLRAVGPDATWITSVCTGSLVLHAAGVAEGCRLATHRALEDTLASMGATVVRDARFVRDGRVVSSQGVSAGLDMALWLIGQLHGVAHARAVQRELQYDPAPPYTADV
jgi:transcriptional regulator GlxA family with amidase domain